MAEAARQALAALREPALAAKVDAFLMRRVPKLAISFRMPQPVGRGTRLAPSGPETVDDLDEVLAVLGLADGIFVHAMVPRPREAPVAGPGPLTDLLEAEFYDGSDEAAFSALPSWDAAHLREALAGARAAQAPDFPALAYVRRHANRPCGGEESGAREWLRRLETRLGRLTFGV